MRFWSDYLPDEGVSMFQKDINEVIELSKQYKKGGS